MVWSYHNERIWLILPGISSGPRPDGTGRGAQKGSLANERKLWVRAHVVLRCSCEEMAGRGCLGDDGRRGEFCMRDACGEPVAEGPGLVELLTSRLPGRFGVFSGPHCFNE